MRPKDFDELVVRRMERCKEVLFDRSGVYSDSDDRLRNFKDAAEYLETSPERVLLGFVTKHLVALKDCIRGITSMSPEDLKEGIITDVINYMLLLEGLLNERVGDSGQMG